MKTVDLSNEKIIINKEHTSKGNQKKWFSDGKWYKADFMGYEGLAEVVVSDLLSKSGINDFVKYEPVMIRTGDKLITGCVSDSFLNANEEFVPIERMHRLFFGKGLAKTLSEISGADRKIKYTADFIDNAAGLDNSGKYITELIEIDALFLNEDRHTNNIAVIRNTDSGKFRLAPVFDNGLSLLSDTNDYPVDADINKCLNKIEAKPFSTSFDEQLDEAVKLYGYQMKWNINKTDVYNSLSLVSEYYSDDILRRAESVILSQMRKFGII